MRWFYRHHHSLLESLRQVPNWLIALCLCAPMAAYSQSTNDDKHKQDQAERSATQSAKTKGQDAAAKNRFNLQQKAPNKSQINSRQAAVIAKQHSGGKVLRVHATDSGHRIKMLLPSGKVTYISVDMEGHIQ